MKKIAMIMVLVLSVVCVRPEMAAASESNEETNEPITYDEAGNIIFTPTDSSSQNARIIEQYLNNDKKKTMIIKEGSTVYVSQVLDIGSNTTIIAKGASIIQTEDGKGMIQHTTKGNKYNAIKNVKIVGGNWKNKVNSKVHTMFRFAHGKNIHLESMNIQTNYRSHGVELIACKDVEVDKCKIIAKNNKTKKSDSVEEALQIDVATPLTAPGIYRETKKKSYVNGQTCQNITIKNSTISGSRGVCANFAAKEKQFKNKFHKNITITNCKITGYSSEGLALLNAMKCKVKNNTIKTLSKRNNSYSDGIHHVLVGKTNTAKKYKSEYVGNKIYGNYYGMDITSQSGSKHGTVVLKKNTIYSRKGKNCCMHIVYCNKIQKSGNKCKKW